VFRIEVNHVKSGIFFASKRNEIFASISNFASEAKVRAHPTHSVWNLQFFSNWTSPAATGTAGIQVQNRVAGDF
jgi:hypothetical protein